MPSTYSYGKADCKRGSLLLQEVRQLLLQEVRQLAVDSKTHDLQMETSTCSTMKVRVALEAPVVPPETGASTRLG